MKKETEKSVGVVLFVAAAFWLSLRAYPSAAEKQGAPLRLNRPVETPDGVYFSWYGGAEDTTYTIFRSGDGGETWVPLVTGLNGKAGNWMVRGFTLDKDYKYRIQAE